MSKSKQVNLADAKPTNCSECRYSFSEIEGSCYFRSHLRSDVEYVNCIPAIIYWNDDDLAKAKVC